LPDDKICGSPTQLIALFFEPAGGAMPQAQLPFFPSGVTLINSNLAFEKKDGVVTYFNGTMPVFSHDEKDIKTFRMITSQFYVNGNATQAEICRAFGIPAITVKRAVKKYLEEGPAGFYRSRTPRGATVLTEAVLKEAQSLLNEGNTVGEIADRLDIKKNTLDKAVLANRLVKPGKKKQTASKR
jgi:transposase-like protein